MKVVLIEGFGFGEQSHLFNELSLHAIDTKSFDIDLPFSSEFKTQVEDAGLVIFRSRWSATAEENIFVKTLFKKHLAYFEVLDKLVCTNKVKVIGIGRGALLWLEWLNFTKKIETPLQWSPEDYVTNSWVNSKVHTQHNSTISIPSLISGRAHLLRLNLGGMAVRTWVEQQEKAVGWVINEGLYLSLVDVLALSERAQLPDFGYEDLSSISTRSNIVQMILAGSM